VEQVGGQHAEVVRYGAGSEVWSMQVGGQHAEVVRYGAGINHRQHTRVVVLSHAVQLLYNIDHRTDLHNILRQSSYHSAKVTIDFYCLCFISYILLMLAQFCGILLFCLYRHLSVQEFLSWCCSSMSEIN